VDNLRTTLIPTLAKLSLRAGGDIDKVAIVVDVREGNFLSSLAEDPRPAPQDAPAQPGADFSRSEPRSAGAAVQRDQAPASARARPLGHRGTSANEHARMQPIRELADEIIDNVRHDRPRAAAVSS